MNFYSASSLRKKQPDSEPSSLFLDKLFFLFGVVSEGVIVV